MLLSINPFKPLNIYTEELRQKYQGKEQQRNPPWAILHSVLFCFLILSITTGSMCLTKDFSSFTTHITDVTDLT